jgi:hypothetical protein
MNPAIADCFTQTTHGGGFYSCVARGATNYIGAGARKLPGLASLQNLVRINGHSTMAKDVMHQLEKYLLRPQQCLCYRCIV